MPFAAPTLHSVALATLGIAGFVVAPSASNT